jgi:anti-sigma factor RsiW
MDMACDRATRLISRSVDGEMTPREAEELRAHLAACAGCREAAEMQARLRARIAALPEPALPPGYAERLRGAVHARLLAEPRPPVSFTFRAVAAAAVVMLSAAVMFLAWRLADARARVAELTARGPAQAVSVASLPGIRPARAGTPEGFAEHWVTFTAARDFYGGRMRWMASDGDQVEFGMSGGAKAANGALPDMLLLQFRYVETGQDLPARVLSGPEFLLVPQEEASVRLKGRDSDLHFRYRVKASQTPDGQIRALVNFATEGRDPTPGVEPALSAVVTLVPGKPVLLTASGDATRRQELYLWGTTKPAGSADQGTPAPL